MPKNLLPWLAIAAIVIALFLLPQFPGRDAAGLRPSEAWKRGVHLLATDEGDREQAAEELLRQATSFEAPEELAADTLALLRAQDADGDAAGRLRQELLDAAERRLATQGER